MGIIRVLDETIACQIAAGEVVERPASVVKELIENAKDAGARRIDVAIADGGVAKIVVADDGCGMSPEDATLCFARHATSKLRTIEQLKQLSTFGFRGEALAAISSVARVRLVTRAPHADSAFEVVVDAGTITSVGDAAGALGTVVEMDRLFSAVPARLKFLKTPRTERNRVERQVKAQALGAPGVAFRFVVDGHEAWSLAGASGETLDAPDRLTRVASCLGADQVFAVQTKTDLLSVQGYVTAPHEARRDGQGLFVSVNGRPVNDRALNATVRMAFRPVLGPRRFPVAVLNVTVEADAVDVNVHPRKDEVRFDDERRVHAHLLGTLSDLCARTPWTRRAAHRTYVLKRGEAPHATDAESSAGDEGQVYDERRARIRRALAQFEARSPVPARPSGGAGEKVSPARTGPVLSATLRNRFLVIEGDEGMTVVDARAALCADAARALAAEWAEGRLRSRTLLFPLRLTLTPQQVLDLEPRRERSLTLGFDLDTFSETGVIVRAVPHRVCGHNAERVFAAYEAWSRSPKDESVLFKALVRAFYEERALTQGELDQAFAGLEGQDAGGTLRWDELAARLSRGTL